MSAPGEAEAKAERTRQLHKQGLATVASAGLSSSALCGPTLPSSGPGRLDAHGKPDPAVNAGVGFEPLAPVTTRR